MVMTRLSEPCRHQYLAGPQHEKGLVHGQVTCWVTQPDWLAWS
jgi:hypothetical protein